MHLGLSAKNVFSIPCALDPHLHDIEAVVQKSGFLDISDSILSPNQVLLTPAERGQMIGILGLILWVQSLAEELLWCGISGSTDFNHERNVFARPRHFQILVGLYLKSCSCQEEKNR